MALRILCLHGYTQNALSFTKKTSAFRKSLKGIADLVYVTAPHIVPIPTLGTPEERENDELEDAGPEDESCGWWTSSPEKPQMKGFDESLSSLREVLETQGPFDGIMGFSQGASMASIVQLLLERPYLSPTMSGCTHPPVKFSIIVAGFEPRDEEKIQWYNSKYPVLLPKKSTSASSSDDEDYDMEDQEDKENVEPQCLYGVQGASMHVIGKGDVIIEPERAELLLKHYKYQAPVLLYHDGGHYLPSNGPSRQAYKSFVQSFV
ncbi:Ovarian cancer-associated protein 2 [Entomortierella beljakovae]|nr:Ovarian cancer-associated protein 2 [Entomortierella beljakovae]